MSNSFPGAIEISLARTAGHWLLGAAGPALALLAIPALDVAWRLPAAALWLALAAATALQLLKRPWRRAIWQPSGAFRLQADGRDCVAQLGAHSYRSRHLIVLHMTTEAKNWYFVLLRADQPDAFRRCAARMRLAGRLRRTR